MSEGSFNLFVSPHHGIANINPTFTKGFGLCKDRYLDLDTNTIGNYTIRLGVSLLLLVLRDEGAIIVHDYCLYST